VPLAGRDIYNWTAEPPADADGIPFAPPGLNAGEFSAVVRTNFLPTVIAAEANLAKVTDPHFTLSLTSNETRIVAVTLDYGDILLLRAILHAAQYFAYTACSLDVKAQLDLIRYLYDVERLSIEQVLMDTPHLLTFATTNDLNSAKLTFQNGAHLYMAASEIIRGRPTNVTRLFNYDTLEADDEAKFRQTLADLTNSLLSSVTLSMDTNYTVFFASHFTGLHSPRSLLPSFHGNAFALGTLPEPTFGGLVYGPTDERLDEFLADYLFPIPSMSPTVNAAGGQLQFTVNVAKDRGYVLQTSTNLLDWVDYSAFVASDARYRFAEACGLPRRFFRVVDRTDNMPPPPNGRGPKP